MSDEPLVIRVWAYLTRAEWLAYQLGDESMDSIAPTWYGEEVEEEEAAANANQ